MSLASKALSAGARAGLGATFVVLGLDAARDPGNRVAMAARIGVPQPELAVRANGAGMVVFGSAMALGIRRRTSALAIAGLLVPTTVAGHAFWEAETEQTRKAQRIQFLKNVGLFGGLLAVAADPTSGGRAGR